MSERFNEVAAEMYKVLEGMPMKLISEVRSLLLDSYEAGVTDAPASLELSNYGNLTGAHKMGKRIDYSQLDGRRVALVCKDGCCKVRGKLTPYKEMVSRELPYAEAWRIQGATGLSLDYFIDSWVDDDWWLWVEGDLPLLAKTANGLPVGMVFRGVWDGNDTEDLFILCKRGDDLTVTSPNGLWGFLEPERVTVLEEYGVGVLPS